MKKKKLNNDVFKQEDTTESDLYSCETSTKYFISKVTTYQRGDSSSFSSVIQLLLLTSRIFWTTALKPLNSFQYFSGKDFFQYDRTITITIVWQIAFFFFCRDSLSCQCSLPAIMLSCHRFVNFLSKPVY